MSDETKKRCYQGQEPVHENAETGNVTTRGPTDRPDVVLHMLAIAVAQVSATLEPKEPSRIVVPKVRT